MTITTEIDLGDTVYVKHVPRIVEQLEIKVSRNLYSVEQTTVVYGLENGAIASRASIKTVDEYITSLQQLIKEIEDK